MSDLIERLKRLKFTRERGDGPNGVCWDEPCDVEDYGAEASLVNPDGAEAADRIVALEAEVERLRSSGEAETTPTLMLARLRDKIERLRKAEDGLASYAKHADNCDAWDAPPPTKPCTCGLTEALTHWQEVSNG